MTRLCGSRPRLRGLEGWKPAAVGSGWRRRGSERDARGRAEKSPLERCAPRGEGRESRERRCLKDLRRRVAVAEGGRRVVIPRGTLGRQAAAVGGTGLSWERGANWPVTRAIPPPPPARYLYAAVSPPAMFFT